MLRNNRMASGKGAPTVACQERPSGEDHEGSLPVQIQPCPLLVQPRLPSVLFTCLPRSLKLVLMP